jgi:hypothetical protein
LPGGRGQAFRPFQAFAVGQPEIEAVLEPARLGEQVQQHRRQQVFFVAPCAAAGFQYERMGRRPLLGLHGQECSMRPAFRPVAGQAGRAGQADQAVRVITFVLAVLSGSHPSGHRHRAGGGVAAKLLRLGA